MNKAKSAVCRSLNRSPKLPVGIHRTGPCLVSQSVKGGAGLQDVVGREGVGGEDLRRMDIRLNGKFSVCGDERGVDSVQF